jgi:hypothetical protein
MRMPEVLVDVLEMRLKLLKTDDIGLVLFKPSRQALVVCGANAVQIK